MPIGLIPIPESQWRQGMLTQTEKETMNYIGLNPIRTNLYVQSRCRLHVLSFVGIHSVNDISTIHPRKSS